MMPMRLFSSALAIVFFVACESEPEPLPEESTTPAPPATTSTPPEKNTPETSPPATPPGTWTKLDLGTTSDVNAVFAPKDGLAFFGTAEGMFRYDGKAVTKVDLGCNCTIEDFDRDSGLAIGMDGAKVYAGVYDEASSGYAPFAWKTERNGPKPRRVAGNASSFVYVPENGARTVRYHPTALFGGPRFGMEAEGGDLLLYGDRPNAVSGTAEFYWVAAGRGMYSHADNYRKATEGDYTFTDVWNGWALRLDNACHDDGTCGGPTFLCKSTSGTWKTDIEVKDAHGSPSRMFLQVKSDALAHVWLLSKRADGTSLGHVDEKLMWTWVDFPKGEELRAAAFTTKDAFVVGRSGVVYRCIQPGCSEPSSAPK